MSGSCNLPKYQHELAVAIEAAQAGAAIVEAIYATDFEIEDKDLERPGQDPVTNADREADAAIVRIIRKAFPDDVIVTEESLPPNGFANARRCWFVDPLDGTRDFVARNGEFCTMVGLAVNGRAQVGAVVIPCENRLLAGVAGLESFTSYAGGPREPLRVSDCKNFIDATLVVSRSRRNELLDVIKDRLALSKELPCGSVGVKVARILMGLADIYLHLPNKLGARDGSKRWDVCAPQAIMEGAGGRFGDARGRAFDYQTSDLLNHDGMLATNDFLHDAIVAAVAATLGDR